MAKKAAKKKVTKKTSKKAKPVKPGFTDGKITYYEGSTEYALIKAARDLEEQGDIRVDRMIFITYTDDMPEVAEEMLSDMGDKNAQKILPVLSGHAYKPGKDDYDDEEYHKSSLWQAIASRHTGKFLVEMSTPVYQWNPSEHSKDGSTHFSEGYRTINWFAGWDMAKIIKDANAWAEKSHDEDVARAKLTHKQKKRKSKAKK